MFETKGREETKKMEKKRKEGKRETRKYSSVTSGMIETFHFVFNFEVYRDAGIDSVL